MFNCWLLTDPYCANATQNHPQAKHWLKIHWLLLLFPACLFFSSLSPYFCAFWFPESLPVRLSPSCLLPPFFPPDSAPAPLLTVSLSLSLPLSLSAVVSKCGELGDPWERNHGNACHSIPSRMQMTSNFISAQFPAISIFRPSFGSL